jgi:hypothetical protein
MLLLLLLITLSLPTICEGFSVCSGKQYTSCTSILKRKLARSYSSATKYKSRLRLSGRKQNSFLPLFSLREPVESAHHLKTNILSAITTGLSLGLLGSTLLDSSTGVSLKFMCYTTQKIIMFLNMQGL